MFSGPPFDSGTPIYIQLVGRIKVMIVSGQWEPGQRMPPVRDLAMAFGVNPNTMQRSMAELEREGLVYSERTAGRYITQDRALIDAVRDAMSRDEASRFRQRMHDLGYTDAHALQTLQSLISEKEEANT